MCGLLELYIMAMVEKNWGKGTLALLQRGLLASLKSILNRDTEEKGIVLRELSCQTAAELPPPELPPKLW